MQPAAEILRWCLVSLQAAAVGWILWSGLWRRLPCWTAWIAAEGVSRAAFSPAGNYWHHVWLPLQPGLFLMLGVAAVEARHQLYPRTRSRSVMVVCLLAPVGMALGLPDLISARMVLSALVVGYLSWPPVLWIGYRPSRTAKWHAGLLAAVCGAAAITGWVPATGAAWWRMRVGFLAVYCCLMLAWGWLLTRSADDHA